MDGFPGHDEVDALLRDPNTPADVRQTILSLHNVGTYLDTIDFHEQEDGTLSVVPAQKSEPVADEQQPQN